MEEAPLSGKRILVAPLNWGLGHATRCIPVIDLLRKNGAVVFIGGEGRSLHLLKAIYPDIRFIDLPAYNIQYSHNSLMVWKTLLQTPRLLGVFKSEHKLLNELVDTCQLDAVLSDNRYGLWTDKVPSVFMCHQLALILPAGFGWARKIIYRLHLRYISRFTHLWIPDEPGEPNLSGHLSHRKDLPQSARFIGYLTRFTAKQEQDSDAVKAERPVLVLLSGPEPQRTLLEEIITKQAATLGNEVIIVRGITEQQDIHREGNITWYNYLKGEELYQMVRAAGVVVARSGYSTVMDLSALGKKVLFIPTPGQTEQEYLARKFAEEGRAVRQSQKEVKLSEGIQEALLTKGMPVLANDQKMLKKAAEEWLGMSLR